MTSKLRYHQQHRRLRLAKRYPAVYAPGMSESAWRWLEAKDAEWREEINEPWKPYLRRMGAVEHVRREVAKGFPLKSIADFTAFSYEYGVSILGTEDDPDLPDHATIVRWLRREGRAAQGVH